MGITARDIESVPRGNLAPSGVRLRRAWRRGEEEEIPVADPVAPEPTSREPESAPAAAPPAPEPEPDVQPEPDESPVPPTDTEPAAATLRAVARASDNAEDRAGLNWARMQALADLPEELDRMGLGGVTISPSSDGGDGGGGGGTSIVAALRSYVAEYKNRRAQVD
jgi:hypothetical protein